MICTIPARGGSKRLVRKNLRMLGGKPLIAHTIQCAIDSGLFPTVYVCTEDAEIAEIACRYGASVPVLVPQELCGDLVASHIPCQFMASHLKQTDENYESLVCLQPSSPLRSSEDIRNAVCAFREGSYDFLVSVTEIDPHYFHWAVVPGESPYWKMFFGSQYLKERPLLPAVCRPNGSIKIAKLDVLARTGNFFGERLGVVKTPEDRSVHVAVEFDLQVCETILSSQISERPVLR